MKKTLKGLFAMLFAFMLLIGLTGCGNNEETPNNDNNNNQQQGEKNSNSLGVGKYKVEKKSNSILVITNDGSAISTTEYKFSNGFLTSAVVTQKCSSSSLAKTLYDAMKNESAITNQYVDIKLSGDTITMNIKNEVLIAYNGMNQDQVYDLMYQTYSAYME